MWQRWITASLCVALLSGCNSWQNYQASVEQRCREQARGKQARFNDCMRKVAAADRERLRHQDQEWYVSLDDAFGGPVIIVAPSRNRR